MRHLFEFCDKKQNEPEEVIFRAFLWYRLKLFDSVSYQMFAARIFIYFNRILDISSNTYEMLFEFYDKSNMNPNTLFLDLFYDIDWNFLIQCLSNVHCSHYEYFIRIFDISSNAYEKLNHLFIRVVCHKQRWNQVFL